MKKSKLFSLVNTFDNSDWNYLSSHIEQRHEPNSEIGNLYAHLHLYKRKLDHDDLSLDNTLQVLFPSKPRKYLQNVMSKLYGIILSALAEKEFHQNEDLKRLTQFEVLQQRQLFSYADKLADASKKQLNDDSKLNLWKGYYDFRLRYVRLMSNHPDNISKPDRFEFIDDLMYSMQLSSSTLAKFLQVLLVNLSRLNDVEYVDQMATLNGVINNHASYGILFHLLKDQLMLVDPNQEINPKYLFETLTDKNHSLSKTLTTAFYISLRIFYLNEARRGNKQYDKELATIIHWSVENMDLIEGMNSISPNTFLTDVNILCYLKAIESANKYVEEFISYIERNMRNQVKELSLMMIDFSFDNFEKALYRYNTTAIKKVSKKILAYNVMLKSVYELGYEFEDLSDRARNVDVFMYRNKSNIKSTMFSFHSNFLKGYKYLISNSDKLEDFLNSELAIKDRHWLKEKMLEK